MTVEGLLKQERIQGCWFVDAKVPSIRMQVKWKTFPLIIFLISVIESAICLQSCLKATFKFLIKSNVSRGAPPEKTFFSVCSGLGSIFHIFPLTVNQRLETAILRLSTFEAKELMSLRKISTLLPPQGFRPEGEIPRRHSSNSRVY